ncbi:MAG: hypothetical protein ABI625_11585, partial [bacterium]
MTSFDLCSRHRWAALAIAFAVDSTLGANAGSTTLPGACGVPRPEPRTGHQLAYDSARQRILMFGGQSGDAAIGYPSTLWAWDGARWTCLSADGPPGRVDATLVDDPGRGVVVLYGGRRRAGQQNEVLSDTWEWNGTRWDLRDTIGLGRREHMVAAFDTRTQSVVVHGGGAGNASLDDTWRWSGTRWTQMETRVTRALIANSLVARPSGALLIAAEAPDSLGAFRAALYEVRNALWAIVDSTGPRFSPQASSTLAGGGNVLMFAGWEPDGRANTITWTEREGWRVRNDPHVRRRGAPVAYDARRNRVVMYGGDDGERVLADTWEWDGRAWTSVTQRALVPPIGR